MDLQLTISGKRDITRQIYRQLRERILNGQLKSGDRLPASRELATELAVARKTITNVYDLLISEGFLDTRIGSGTFVATNINLKKKSPFTSPLIVNKQWLQLSSQLRLDQSNARFDFGVGVPDVSRFPYTLWRSILGSCARLLSRNTGKYEQPEGYQPLRDAIASYISFTRAVVCRSDDVVVTNGAQQAFALIAYTLISNGETVAMEQPGYHRARWLFEAHRARIVDVPVDNEGLIVERIPRQAKLVYVTPSHQYPLGVCMSLPRRLALLKWASQHGAAIIEDDYDSEFRFEARPLDSLQSLDRQGVVLYVGTFSKVLFPGVRTGFVIAPEPVRSALIAARQLMDWHGSLLTQAALARFIRDGHLARHIRKMRRIYAERRQRILSCLQTELQDYLKIWPSLAGLHLAVKLQRDRSADIIVDSAKLLGVAVQSLGNYGLALGYGAIDRDSIEPGIKLLKQVMKRSK